MRLPAWYVIFASAWLLLFSLPIVILALGFGGGSLSLPDPRIDHAIDIVSWLAAWALILLPLWVLPFVLWRNR